MTTKKAGALKLLGRDEILAAADAQSEIVPVPEWGGAVRIDGLTGTERDQYEAWIISGKGKNRDVNLRQARSKLVMMCARDADGKRLFDEADLLRLGAKSALAMRRVF